MNAEQFKRDVVVALVYFMDWIRIKNRMDLLQNVPKKFQNSAKEKEIKDCLYQIYSFDFTYRASVNNPVEQQAIRDLTRELDVFKASLAKAAELCSSGARKGICCKPWVSKDIIGWIFCGPVGSEEIPIQKMNRRMYINVKTEFLSYFIGELIEEMKRGLQTQFNFKFANPFAVHSLDLMRPEKIVFYIPEGEDLAPLTTFLYKQRRYFDREVPLFVHKVMDGVGYAPHVTPSVQAYLNAPTNSYGETVCHIIARFLLSFIVHRGFPQEKDYHEIAEVVYGVVYEQAFRMIE